MNKNIYGPKSSKIDLTYINILLNALSQDLEYKTFSTGRRFTMTVARNNECYFVRSGVVSLSRAEGNVLFEILEAPTIRGLVPLHPESRSSYILKVIEPAEIAIINRERMYELLTRYQLWGTFSQHIVTVASMMMEVFLKLTMPSSYDIVRMQLFELMSKPEHIRESMAAEQYICSKTQLSRSTVMRILGELKTRGAISMQRGILKKINQLPAEE